MVKITIDLPEELSDKLTQLGNRLPEFITLSLQQPAIPATVYRYIIDFLASQPTPEQILDFRPTSTMQERLKILLIRNQSGDLTAIEQQELDEYEKIEHLIIMLKAGSLPYLTRSA